LEHFQEKSYPERKRIAFIVAGSVTLIIFLIWVSFLFGGNLKDVGTEESSEGIAGDSVSMVGENFEMLYKMIFK